MRHHSITAIVAAEIAVCFKLRSRLVQLTPRAFHLLSRNRSVSSTARRSFETTAYRRAQPAETAFSSEASQGQDEGSSDLSSTESATPTADHDPQSNRRRDPDYIAKKQDQQRAFFIDLMRTVPHPVAVVTARKQHVEDDVQGTVAATVSSFNTVSIKPDLVVSFNLKSDSITYQTILDSSHFTVTFAQMNAAGAHLVHAFTKGNDPSPFTIEYPDHPTPRPFQWGEDGIKAYAWKIRHSAPAVCLTDPDDPAKSGFAFAFTCEYRTSTPVGDHVIVTGRLLPRKRIRISNGAWGAMTSNDRIVSHQVTLSHVHGTYSNSDTGLGFANLLKIDDQSLGPQADEVDLQSKIAWCRSRIETFAGAQMIRQGISATIVKSEKAGRKASLIREAARIEPKLLEEYQRYYMQRLQYLEFQAQKLPKDIVSPKPEETDSETNSEPEEVTNVPYVELLGHQQMFVRNKMLLAPEELDEEIALYSMRLSALRIKAKKDLGVQVLEEETKFAEELPEESESSLGLQPEDDGLSRNMQLRRYFLGRIHLLQHAKTRQTEFTKPREKTAQPKIAQPADEQNSPATIKRFVGANRNDTLVGLKTKYRRYQYQLTEARLSLLGLEQLPEVHPNVPILKDRIKYFEPRLEAIQGIIVQRAKEVSIRDLLIENFQPPPMRNSDPPKETKPEVKRPQPSKGKGKGKGQPNSGRKLIRSIILDFPQVDKGEGDSVDQLDHETKQDLFLREEQTRAAIRQAANKLPIGVKPTEFNTSPPSNKRTRTLSPEEEAAEELQQMRKVERDLLRQNANQVRDYLVMQTAENEEMPSPADFMDVNKMREERLRKEEEERKEEKGAQ